MRSRCVRCSRIANKELSASPRRWQEIREKGTAKARSNSRRLQAQDFVVFPVRQGLWIIVRHRRHRCGSAFRGKRLSSLYLGTLLKWGERRYVGKPRERERAPTHPRASPRQRRMRGRSAQPCLEVLSLLPNIFGFLFPFLPTVVLLSLPVRHPCSRCPLRPLFVVLLSLSYKSPSLHRFLSFPTRRRPAPYTPTKLRRRRRALEHRYFGRASCSSR